MSNQSDNDGHSGPFISIRSPSYERARHEHAHPSAAPDPMLVATLARLCEAEHDAIHLCQVAAELVAPEGVPSSADTDTGTGSDGPYDLLCALVVTHQQHRDALAATIAAIGAAAPRPGSHARVLSRDPDDLRYGKLAAEIIAAVAAGEEELEAYYRKAEQTDLVQTQPQQSRIIDQLDSQRTALRRHQTLLDSLVGNRAKRF